MIASTYLTAKLIAVPVNDMPEAVPLTVPPEYEPLNEWLWLPSPPVVNVFTKLTLDRTAYPVAPPNVGAIDVNPILCACDGICAVVSVVPPTDPLTVPPETDPETDPLPTEPETACEAKAVVKLTDPPLDVLPETIRNAALSFDVNFVQPDGADV